LNLVGADIETITLTLNDTTFSRNIDYTVFPGNDSTPVMVEPIASGAIENGSSIVITYSAFENYTIVYTTNSLLGNVQNVINKMKHACADALVKQAVNNNVNITLTVIPQPMIITSSSSALSFKSQIITSLANFIGNLGVGVSLTQSDVIKTINSVPGVDYVVLPLSTMVKADNSFIARDDIGTPFFEIYTTGSTVAYITTEPVLTYQTIDQGGPSTLFRAIFENSVPLILQSDPIEVSSGPGLGYIMSDGRIIVSTRDGTLPDTKLYEVAYWTFGETGAKDIQVNALEYLSLGTCNIIFGSPRTIKQTL
jgi:hypothetical protein